MADAAAKNKILVLSRASVNTAALVNEVVSRPALNADQGGTIAQVAWTINTKYFTAPVELWLDHTEPLPPAHQQFMQSWLADPSSDDSEIPLEESMRELHTHLGEVTDGVVFVFDPAQPQTFLDILPWAGFAKHQVPSILLCVAVRQPGCEDDKDRWFRWCTANGWEWVDLVDDPVTRVREALETNEWATMQMKSTRAADPTPVDEAEPAVAGGPRPEDERAGSEWDRFEHIANQVDTRRVADLSREFFADGMQDGDEMAAMLARIREAKDEIAQISDPEQARLRAAELALAIARET